MMQPLSKLIRYIVNDFRPWLCFAVGIGVLVFTPERPDSLFIAPIFIGLGFFLLWLQRKQEAIGAFWDWVWRKILGEQPIDKLPPEKQTGAVLRLMLIMGLALLPAAAITIYELLRLESDEVESVRVWAPIALLYDLFGFWPAVLFVPFVWGILIIALSMLLFRLRRQSPPAA
jgi:hypothetical protein